jgi:hypothetical protein
MDAAKRKKETAKNQIIGMMGNNENAYWQGDLIFTYRANKNGVRSFRAVGGK